MPSGLWEGCKLNLPKESDCISGSHYLWEDPPDEEKYSQCVHCGLCLESCPTYQEMGQEQQSPRGRVHLIKAAAEGKIQLNEAFSNPIFTCLDCRACETACPAGVQVGLLIEEARGQIRQAIPLKGWRKWISSLFFRKVFPYPSRLQLLGKLLRFYQKSGLRTLLHRIGLLRVVPSHLRAMEAILPEAKPSVLSTYPTTIKSSLGETKRRVALFTGCVMDVIFSDVHEATIRVLARNGSEVVIPREQRCCGALHIHAGDRQTGKRLARENIDAFLTAGVDTIIVNSAGCGCALKEYPELLHSDPVYRQKAERFSAKVEDISKFLHQVGYEKPEAHLDTQVAYHDACHLAHGQGIREEPRQLLQQIPGVKLLELPDADRCCGSAGIYNLTNPEMAEALLDRKMDDIPREAEWITMGNPGCMLQVAKGVKKHGHKGRVVHTIQLLDWAYAQETDRSLERDQVAGQRR
ncbi:(Fe-S)-binding protein [Brevibacillus humidisoli]|uniref:(Fe-S)-binding protein n=1 Tax=Brevibacillus humidisoli TaxID=2895522 RepID=UPI001E5829C9|nr:(Fe-S)-binding protein [Brevibacillus humidisoli]UFJ42704.1 (Fe-S)-binding protein [Brevibacillus humidisoli]